MLEWYLLIRWRLPFLPCWLLLHYWCLFRVEMPVRYLHRRNWSLVSIRLLTDRRQSAPAEVRSKRVPKRLPCYTWVRLPTRNSIRVATAMPRRPNLRRWHFSNSVVRMPCKLCMSLGISDNNCGQLPKGLQMPGRYSRHKTVSLSIRLLLNYCRWYCRAMRSWLLLSKRHYGSKTLPSGLLLSSRNRKL